MAVETICDVLSQIHPNGNTSCKCTGTHRIKNLYTLKYHTYQSDFYLGNSYKPPILTDILNNSKGLFKNTIIDAVSSTALQTELLKDADYLGITEYLDTLGVLSELEPLEDELKNAYARVLEIKKTNPKLPLTNDTLEALKCVWDAQKNIHCFLKEYPCELEIGTIFISYAFGPRTHNFERLNPAFFGKMNTSLLTTITPENEIQLPIDNVLFDELEKNLGSVNISASIEKPNDLILQAEYSKKLGSPFVLYKLSVSEELLSIDEQTLNSMLSIISNS
ncbi:hypothetical protein GQ473_07555 [archaeon]|nr:hypothetical protein [archaeon]